MNLIILMIALAPMSTSIWYDGDEWEKPDPKAEESLEWPNEYQNWIELYPKKEIEVSA